MHIGLGLGGSSRPAAEPFVPVGGYTAWLDPTDLSSLYSDFAATTNVAANGDYVRAWKPSAGTLTGWRLGAYDNATYGYSLTENPKFYATAINGHPGVRLERIGTGSGPLLTELVYAQSIGVPWVGPSGLCRTDGGTVFVVWKPGDEIPDLPLTFMLLDSGGYGALQFMTDKVRTYLYHGTLPNNADKAATPDADVNFLMFGWDGATKYAGFGDFSDAALATEVAGTWLGSGNDIRLGTANPGNTAYGYVGDVVFYPSWLSEASRAVMAERLASRYA